MPCSNCGCQDHNIRLCNDPTITTCYYEITRIYFRTRRSNFGAQFIYFYDSVSQYTLKKLKAVVAKFVGGNFQLPKRLLINCLWTHYSSNLHDTELVERVTLPNIPDVIPSYAQDQAINNGPGSVVQRSVLRTSLFEILRDARARFLNTNAPQVIEISSVLEDYVAFHSEKNKIAKKYNISTRISVTETTDELEKCEDCPICFEETKLLDTVTINCGHKFCGTCITNTLKMYNNMSADPDCAFCRRQMTSFVVKNPEIYSLVSEHCIM